MSSSLRRILYLAFLCLFTLVLFVAIRALFFQTFRVVSDSMSPTLQSGDRVLVFRAAYSRLFSSGVLPQRGDVVVFRRFSEYLSERDERKYIKRIVAIPGDTVAVRGSDIVVGDAATEGDLDYGPLRLSANQYFVAGDNRNNSQDSRFYGPIHVDDVEGEAIRVLWSGSIADGIQWERFWKEIPEDITVLTAQE